MLQQTLHYAYYVLLSITTLIGLVVWRRMDDAGKATWVIIFLTLLSETARTIFRKQFPAVNPILMTFAGIVEVVGFSYVFLKITALQKRTAMMLLIVSLTTAALSINLLIFQPVNKLGSNFFLFEGVLLTVLAIFALYHLTISPDVKSLMLEPMFWVWAVLLFYQCTTLAFWGSIQILDKASAPLRAASTQIHLGLNLLLYSGIALAFSLYGLRKKN